MDQDRQDALSLEDAETLGEALRAARLASGRSMAQLSTMTRVHPRYLTALEQGEYAVLPSRIFSMGYVRAYAGALGLDELTAVERFKREFPEAAVTAAARQARRSGGVWRFSAAACQPSAKSVSPQAPRQPWRRS